MSATQPGSVDTTRDAPCGFVLFGEGLQRLCLYGKQTPNVPPPPSRQPQLWFSCLAGVCNSKEPNNWVRASIRAGRAGEAGAGGSELPQLRARGWVWIQRLEPLTDTRALSAAGATQGHLVLPIHSQALLFAALLLPLSRSGRPTDCPGHAPSILRAALLWHIGVLGDLCSLGPQKLQPAFPARSRWHSRGRHHQLHLKPP